ncbi:hypothetical protein L0Y69_03435 [bacterium]|nr:hypothetical protein [bacterium]
MQYTPYQLSEMFRKLPPDVREAHGSIEYEKEMEAIENKFHLHIDQAGALSNEVFLLMLGLTHPEEFTGKVQRSVSVPSETAKQIAEEINMKIFKPIRSSLMRIHKMIDEEEDMRDEEEAIVSAAPPVEEKARAETKPSTPAAMPMKVAAAVPMKVDAANKTGTANVAEEKLKATFSIPKKEGGKEGGYTGKDPYHEEVG